MQINKTEFHKERPLRKRLAQTIITLLLGAMIFALSLNTRGLISTFITESQRAGITIPGPEVAVNTHTTLMAFAMITGVLAVLNLFKFFDRQGSIFLIVSIALAVFSFLVWATKGKSLNLTGMFVSSIVRATPICLAALAGLYSERSGVTNIGIEGMILFGAFLSVILTSITHNILVGILAGMFAGLLLASLHAVLSIRYKVNQIISGTAIIIFALGLTSYLQRAVLNDNPSLNNPGLTISAIQIPVLWKIPFFGPIFFNQSPIVYAMFVLIIVTHIFFNYTKWGLRIRSVGEHPKAADTLGVNVIRLRYISVLISGMIAGFAGAYMSIGSAGRFNEGMSAGKGFLGMAAMIFGNWNSIGSFFGAFVFGFFDSWQEKMAILQIGVPIDLLGMAPYIATMIVLSGFIGKSRGPAAGGIPYEKK